MRSHKTTKKVLSMLLCLCMILKCFSVTAFAVAANTPAEMYIKVIDAVSKSVIRDEMKFYYKNEAGSGGWGTVGKGYYAVNGDGYYYLRYAYSDVDVTFEGNDTYPPQTHTVTRTKDNWDNQYATVGLNPYRTASITVKNSDNTAITNATVNLGGTRLSHTGNGVYSGKVAYGDGYTLSIQATGYPEKTATVSMKNNLTTTYTLNCPSLTLDLERNSQSGMTYVLNMETGKSYTIKPSVTIPSDATLKIEYDDGALNVTPNGTQSWTVTPKKSGSYGLQLAYEHNGTKHLSMMINGDITQGSTAYPGAPTLGSSDTDQTQESFKLPSDLKMAQRLTIKAEGAVDKTQTFTGLTAGQTIIMNLGENVVQGEVKYTFTYTSDDMYYSGTAPERTKKYYKSISNVQFGSTELYYNGQHQYPTVTADGEYTIETGCQYAIVGMTPMTQWSSGSNIIPNENTKYTDPTYGFTTEITAYLIKVKGKEEAFYKGEYTKSYTIVRRPLSVTVKNQDIIYGDDIASGTDAVTISDGNLISGHTMSLNVTPSTTMPTDNGTLTASDITIMSDSQDVTRHYNVTVNNNPAKLTIGKIASNRITVEVPQMVTYNGKEQTPAVVKMDDVILTPGSDYSVSYTNNIDAGTAKVVVSNAVWEVEKIEKTFEIKKRPLNASIINAGEIYDGTAKAENARIVLDDVITGDDVNATANISYADANVSYKNGDVIGKTVIATGIELTGDDANNYELTDDMAMATATISPRSVTVIAEDASKIYGEDDPETMDYTVDESTPLIAGENLAGRLERESGENADSYVIGVGTLINDNPNYAVNFDEGIFTIHKRELTVDVAVHDKQYDGLVDATYTAKLNGVQRDDAVTLVTEGVVAVFENEEVGTDKAITLSKEFSVDCEETVRKNYYLTQPAGLIADIYNDYDAVEYVTTPDEWTNASVSIVPAEGYLISTENTDAAEWESVLTFDEPTDKEGQEITFYLRNSANKAISLPETVTYYIDKTNPTATITLGENKWNSLMNDITFDKFFNKEQTVAITAEDEETGSGIAEIYYYLASGKLTEEKLKDVSWTEYENTFCIDQNGEYVIYAKAVDNAGNTVYINSEGLVFDAVAPVITGVENNSIYYGDTEFGVDETYMDTVTVDGNPVNPVAGKYTIIADGKEHTIVAVDKVGNSSEVIKITVITIASLDDTIEHIKTTDVKSSDKENIKKVLDFVDSLIGSGKNFTEAEDEQLSNIKSNAERLLKQIVDTETKVKDLADKAEGITSDNVTADDKADLEKTKTDLVTTLENYEDNLTEDEKETIKNEIKRMDDALKVISNVEAVEEEINSLPKNITKNDKTAIKAAEDAYNALSEYEKSLVDKDVKKALDDAKKDLANLNKSADLNKSAGNDDPGTGDNSNLWLWLTLLLISGASIFGFARSKHKKTIH